MTAILCDKAFGKLMIFADGRVSEASNIITDKCKKIYRQKSKHREVLFAFAGDSAPCDYLLHRYMEFKDYKAFMKWGFEGHNERPLPEQGHTIWGVIADYNTKTKELVLLSIEKRSDNKIIAIYTHHEDELPLCYGCGGSNLKMGYECLDINSCKSNRLDLTCTTDYYELRIEEMYKALAKVDCCCSALEQIEEIKL